jgi:hypothetical protein
MNVDEISRAIETVMHVELKYLNSSRNEINEIDTLGLRN